MRKVVLYIAASLDGFIADTGGGVDWLGGDGSDSENPGSYNRFFDTVGAVVFGYTTYNQIVTELAQNRWDYAGKDCYVITSRKLSDNENVRFVNESPAEVVRHLKVMEGKPVWICGGASIINQLLNENLIDEIIVTIMPTILGGGVRLFSDRDIPIRLKLISTETYNGITDLSYEVIK